ncbi:MAG: type II secretion system protein GspM [Gammaproteobacteria bacterium]
MKQNKKMERWLAVGLLAAAIALLAALTVIPAINKVIELNGEEDSLALKLKKYERILSRKGAVTESVEAVNEQIQQQGYFSSQQTEALASADMQEFIKKAIVDAGGKLSSTQALPVKSKDNFSLLTVSVRMTGNIEVLRSVLHQL